MAICELEFPAGLHALEFDNPERLANALADHVAERLSAAIASNPHGVATLVVSGGKSPVAFFQALAQKPIEWSKVAISLADERWVPTEHADSNAGLLKRYLLQGPAQKSRFLQPVPSNHNAGRSRCRYRRSAQGITENRRAGAGHG